MSRPTYDDLREEESPGILEREQLERKAPAMAEILKRYEAALREIAAIEHSHRAARIAREALK